MKAITVRSPAKVNLLLRVLGRRPDGYHELETIFQTIDLWDDLIISEAVEGCRIQVPGMPWLETSDNLVVKALRWIEKRMGTRLPCSFRLIKRIPEAGGLGGGSSNAAAALKGLRELFQLPLADRDMHQAAVELGADVAFFLLGGCRLGRGVGGVLTEMDCPTDYGLVLVNPGISVSTAAVFREYSKVLTEFPRQAMLGGSMSKVVDVGSLLANDLQPVSESLYPEIREARHYLRRMGLRHVLMTGSGPTVFGLFDASGGGPDPEPMRALPDGWRIMTARPVKYGVVQV
ncbi:MAG: 4-(cytidine 5'-diphospho)-2-C-methyl-D-erythritol kinase [Pseudomonadota bacterium]